MRSILKILSLAVMFTGCTAIMIGTLQSRSETLMIAHDRPPIHSRNPDGTPNGTAGNLDKKARETIVGLGYWQGGLIYSSYYLVRHEGKEFFLLREDVWNADDQLFQRYHGRFRLDAAADRVAWERARTYVANNGHVTVEVSNDNLIKTATPTDSIATGYTITRVPVASGEFEYEIICSAIRPGFRKDSVAAALGYFMANGKWYTYAE